MKRFTLGIGLFILLVAGLLALSAAAFDIRFDYTLQTVMFGAGVLGLISGVLGSFAVLRQQSLLGDTLSHAALPGVVIAFVLAGRDLGWLLLGAGIAGWLGTLLVTAVLRTTRIKQDAALGIILATFFGFGVALLSYNQGREDASRAGLDKFIFGQAAAMSAADVQMVTLVTGLLLVIVVLFWKEFKLLSFDTEFASTNGYPVRGLDMLLSTLIVISIVLGLRLAGVILMVGMLIAPAVAARQWTNHLGEMVVLAGLFGAAAGISGAIISAAEDGLPTGPLIIVAVSLLVLVSLMIAPERGLVWVWLKQRQDRKRFACEAILGDMYRLAQRHQDMAYPTPEGMLTSVRGTVATVGIKELQARGLIQSDQHGGWSLTAQGITTAEETQHENA